MLIFLDKITQRTESLESKSHETIRALLRFLSNNSGTKLREKQKYAQLVKEVTVLRKQCNISAPKKVQSLPTNIKKVQCNLCDKWFKEKGLEAHKRRCSSSDALHTTSKALCDICGLYFKKKGAFYYSIFHGIYIYTVTL